jgi:hypothetical protein
MTTDACPACMDTRHLAHRCHTWVQLEEWRDYRAAGGLLALENWLPS